MNIINNKKVISELELALSYYIKGLIVRETSQSFVDEIQRITEQALISYSQEDINDKNFLMPIIKIDNEKIIISLNNEYLRNLVETKYVKVKIPYTSKKNNDINSLNSYILGGMVVIEIIE